MPKINVYLPESLATAVRAAGFPVSPVCQQALADAVRAVTAARKAVEAIRDPRVDPGRYPAIEERLTNRMTPRLGRALELAREASGPAGTGRLLLGLLAEGDNLGLRALQSLDVDLDELRSAIEQAADAEEEEEETSGASGPSLWADLTMPARRAIAAALEVAIEFGHNYLGCEHLLLGLLAEPDGAAARALREHGAEPGDARRAIKAILAGYTQARQTAAQDVPEIMRRLDAIERRLSSLGA